MRFNRKLLAALLTMCMVLGTILPISAADLKPAYGEAKYYEIAVTNYSRMLMFQNGVVAAANTSKQYGLIDAAGNVVVPFQYSGIWALDGGLFKVSSGSSSGVIDSTGKEIVAMGNHYIATCNHIIQVDDKYYTTEMKPSTSEAFYGSDSSPLGQYDWSYETNGYYVVTNYNNWTDRKSGVMDKNYKFVVPMQDADFEIVSDGKTTLIVATDGKVYDASGKQTSFSGQYDEIEINWSGSPMLYVSKAEQKGVIDYTGKVLVPLDSYEGTIGGMSQNGCISVYSHDNDQDGNISNAVSQIFKDGKQIKTIQGKYVATEAYYRDLAFIANGSDKVGIMDLNEKVIIPAQYYTISGDDNGNLLTEKMDEDWNSTFGLYTYDGKQIFADKYEAISYLKDNKYRLYDGEFFGVTSLNGSAVIPMKYTDMRFHTMNFIELYDGSKHSVVDLNNKTIVPATSQDIRLFNSPNGIGYDIDDAAWNAPAYDHYDASVLPFCYKLADGSYATVYADYKTGEVTGTVANRASLINSDGLFAYQATNGLFGFGGINGALDKVNAPANSSGFSDVPDSEWFASPVKWAVEQKITSGTSDTTFSPAQTCTQAQILSFLWRAKGSPEPAGTASLPDVDSKAYYYKAAVWAIEQGMIDGDFSAETPCTRAMAVTYMWKQAGSPKASSVSFTDVPADAAYAQAVAWAAEKEVTSGTGNNMFSPDKTCTRAEIVAFLYRAFAE